MSIHDLRSTSTKRSANMQNFLAEASAKKQAAEIALEEKAREDAKLQTFIPNMGKRRSAMVIGGKEKATKEAVKNATAMVVARIVTESMPMSLEHLTEQELIEQIEIVKNDMFDGIIDSSLIECAVPNLQSKTLGMLETKSYLEDTDGTPVSLLKKIIAVNAKEKYKSGENTKNATLYNNIKINSASNDMPDSPEKLQQLSTFIADTTSSILGVYSKHIQTKCSNCISNDMADNSDKDKYEGLSEAVISMRKSKDRRKTQTVSVSKELFKTVSVLNESHGATASDYLNESFFQLCILESYRLLEAVPYTDLEIADKLRKKRAKFSN